MPELYHATHAGAADAILRDGFRDASGSYGLIGMTLTGVFVSDHPVSDQDGARGDVVLMVTLPDDLAVGDWEIVEDGQSYREWCIPADVLNRYPVRLVPDETS